MEDYWGWDYMFGRWKNLWLESLYIGNLEQNMRDRDLYDLFSQTAHVVSVHICRDPETNVSFGYGYGYVFFANHHDAERALRDLNFVSFNGKSLRIMYYGQSLNLNGVGNIFIKNLDKSIDHEALYETFSCYGSIVRSKVATDASGQSKGFGFVQYITEESAHKAIEHMNGKLLKDKKVYVGPFLQRDSQGEKAIFVNVVVKQLPKSMTELELNRVFQEFGPTTSCEIKINDQGKSKRFGYVTFVNPDDAAKSVKALNGKKFGYYKKWFVAKSKDKYEMALEIKRRLKKVAERCQGTYNLCVKKLHKCVTDEILRDLFSPYGTITSCKVLRDSNGVSKGSGFVEFSNPEEASRAMLGEILYPLVEQLEPESAAKITGMILEMDQTQVLHLLKSLVWVTRVLAKLTPERQKELLGEMLYPMVEKIVPDLAPKITGMIIDLDQSCVLPLLDSPESLKIMVEKAIEVLRDWIPQNVKRSAKL